MNQPRMNHDDWQELAVGFAFHALEPDEERELLAHLATCDDCTQLVAETQEVTSVLSDDPYGFDQPGAADLTADDLASELAGSGLRDRIVAAAAADPRARAAGPRPRSDGPAAPGAPSVVNARSSQEGTAHVVSRGASPASSRRFSRALTRSRIAVGAVAAALAVAVAVPVTLATSGGSAGTGRETALVQALLQPGAREFTLIGSSGAKAKAVVSSKGVILLADGLAANDTTDQTYVLWADDKSGVRPIATFDAASGKTVQVAADAEPFKAGDISFVAVSREPGRTAPRLPSDIVLASKTA